MKILINGQSDDKVSAHDRAVHYGDGLFETIAIKGGVPQHWPLHWQRLEKGCMRLFMSVPDKSACETDIAELASGHDLAIVKLIVSRGCGNRGYIFPETEITRIAIGYSWPETNVENAKKGINLKLCKTQVAKQPVLAGLKHLNRLENVLARNEWQGDTFAEGLMCDTDEKVIEGTMTNIFLIKAGKLQTPALDQCGVEGITRKRILSIANRERLENQVCDLALDDVKNADEVFVCNSIIGIWPVSTFENVKYQNLQDPDSITRSLQRNLDTP